MKQTKTTGDLELLIPDYLNGHAKSEDSAAIEAMLVTDQEFEQMVEHQRKLRLELQSRVLPTRAQPDFQKLEDKIEKKSGRFLFGPIGLSASLTFALLLMVTLGNWSTNNLGLTDFETLSSSSNLPVSERPTLRVVGVESISEREYRILFSAHDLTLVQKFPSYNVYDVTLSQESAVDQLIEILQKDDRIRSVQLKGEQP